MVLGKIKEVLYGMVVVKKSPGDSDESMIRKFSRKVLMEGILVEAKNRQFHLKPSAALKKKAEDKRRARKLW